MDTLLTLCRYCSRPITRCTETHPQHALCEGWRHDHGPDSHLTHNVVCGDGGPDGESFTVAAPPAPRPRMKASAYTHACPECGEDAENVAADVNIGGMFRDVFLCTCGLQFDVSSYA